MTAYEQGTYYERRTAEALERDGYLVWLARGSKGPADLIALKPGQVLLVQVKKGNATLRGSWWNELYALARNVAGVPIVADWPARGSLRLRRITARHTPRSQAWPCEPFTLDLLEHAVACHPAGRRREDE